MTNLIQEQRPNCSVYSLNELYNSGKVYIMDNHMAASWCWSKKIDFNQQYNLFHIDKHYDLLNGSTDFLVSQLLNRNFNLEESTIEEYVNVTHDPIQGINNYQIFRFDNYMTVFRKLYPEVLKEIKFATHKDGTVPGDWIFYEAEIYDLPNALGDWINETDENWIINIDIDYFFDQKPSGEYFQFLTDEYVELFAEEILLAWDNIKVITIALSPTFCGGIDNSKRLAKLICDKLNVNFE